MGGFLIQRQPGHPGFFLLNYQHPPPPPTRENEEGHAPVAELIKHLTKAQQAEMTGHHKKAFDAGKALGQATEVLKPRGLHRVLNEDCSNDHWMTRAS